jgi:hypothetical protein
MVILSIVTCKYSSGEIWIVAGGLEADIDRDILRKIKSWHCPALGELKFPGLVIKEGCDLHSQHIALPLIMTVLCLIIFGARLLYGDWSIAWNVGCFFVALIGPLGMWIRYVVS